MNSCRLCEQKELNPLINFGQHPIAHRFLTTPTQDEYVHPVTICLCGNCGLIQLTDPIPPDLLYKEYFCLSSWKWQPHIPKLLELINQIPGLTKQDYIFEIGCNDGLFLDALLNHGFERVLGIEPAQDAFKAARGKGLNVIGEYLTTELAEKIVSQYGQTNLFVARQVLEHITDLETFRDAMSILLRPGGHVLIEVPNFEFNLTTSDYSAIWEEHANYFTVESLKKFLAQSQIEVIRSETFNFSGDALVVLGRSVGKPLPPLSGIFLEDLKFKAFAYRDYWPDFCSAFIKYLSDHKKAGNKLAVYGAGCRACSLINFTGISPYLDCILDDQPEKQGKFMPGSHLPILSGNTLENGGVDVCMLAVNAENDKKVIEKHQGYVNRGGLFVPILPPSEHLLPFWSYHNSLEGHVRQN